MKYIIVVDKQPRTNPSAEKRETTIDIEELRRKGEVYDDFKIEQGVAKVYRRIGLTKYHVTYVLDEELIEELGELKIPLFKGDNYIYIKDEYNNNMCAEYVIDNEFNDRYITNLQMESAIEETASQIKLYVGQVLEGYSDTETTKAMIDMKADEIKEEVSRDYATQDALEQEKSERVQTANSIVETVSETYSTKGETSTAKDEAINSANTSTDNKLKNYSTTVQMNSAITQIANEINLELNKKVNNEDITGAYLILKINEDESSGKLKADKLELLAEDIFNIISNNELNLTSRNISIVSANFTVNKNGEVLLKSDEKNAMFTVESKNDSAYFSRVFPRSFISASGDNDAFLSTALGYGLFGMNTNGVTTVCISGELSDPNIYLQTDSGIIFSASKRRTVYIRGNSVCMS